MLNNSDLHCTCDFAHGPERPRIEGVTYGETVAGYSGFRADVVFYITLYYN